MKKLVVVICSIWMMCVMTACGTDEQLTQYHTDMTSFFDRLSAHNASINAINPASPTATKELLQCLDDMAQTITWMAELEVPEQFSAIESLADEADENMQQAVSLYHQAFEGAEYDENRAKAAKEYYDRTNLRIQYMITILHGEIPEGEGVTYTEESSLLGGGYLNQNHDEEQEDGQSVSDGDDNKATIQNEVEESTEDFDTDDTVFYEE